MTQVFDSAFMNNENIIDSDKPTHDLTEDDALYDERADENEAPIREVTDTTETPEEFQISEKDALEDEDEEDDLEDDEELDDDDDAEDDDAEDEDDDDDDEIDDEEDEDDAGAV